jgi:hypothetical protein
VKDIYKVNTSMSAVVSLREAHTHTTYKVLFWSAVFLFCFVPLAPSQVATCTYSRHDEEMAVISGRFELAAAPKPTVCSVYKVHTSRVVLFPSVFKYRSPALNLPFKWVCGVSEVRTGKKRTADVAGWWGGENKVKLVSASVCVTGCLRD